MDGEGRGYAQTLGNAIAPDEVIKDYGADILRLWVASLDYRVDVRLSKDILKQLSEAYRKIRNTARFILGNLSDFDPDRDSVEYRQFEEIDRWALIRLDDIAAEVSEAYESFTFHEAFHRMHQFCVVDLSNFYLDVLKDRLYVEKAGQRDPPRRPNRHLPNPARADSFDRSHTRLYVRGNLVLSASRQG